MTRVSLAPIDEGAPFLALKTLNSGYVGTSSFNGQGGNVSAKMVSSGGYLFYQVRVLCHLRQAFLTFGQGHACWAIVLS
jgi:hypothetical protein